MIDVSLIICTRDRGASLARTLASITHAAGQACKIEVVVVDNGSRDDTPARLASWSAQQAFPVILVDEPRAGLARARNAGLARASGRIVAMTDDDCVLDPGYFAMLTACLARLPGPVVVGGRILLGDPADLPVTIKLEDHAMRADPDGFPGGFVMGANLAFTRDVIDMVGAFDERFGAGTPFLAAEDTDFLVRALDRGIAVRYDPHFVVLHHHGRRTRVELRRLLAGYAFGDGALYAKHWRSRRIKRAFGIDVRAAAADVRGDEQPGTLLRRFHLYRLRHLCRGFLSYLWHTRRAGGPRRAPAARSVVLDNA